MKNKVLIVIFLLMASVSAWAQEFVVDGLRYEVINTTNHYVSLINIHSNTSAVVIPSTIENEEIVYTVTRIGEGAFSGCGWIESVIIPSTVLNIGSQAFFCCSKLSSITIPNSVVSIGDTAFAQTGLASVIIGDSVRNIGKYAFGRCEKLTSITIPNLVKVIEDISFYECRSLISAVIGDSVKSIGNYAFYGCSNLTSITIPNSVLSIGEGAYKKCEGVKSVAIGDGVKSIGDYAFSYCTQIISLTIGDSLKCIGQRAFGNCESLKSVTIGESVESVGESAFNDCDSLISVIIKSDVSFSNSELKITKDGIHYRVLNKNTVEVCSIFNCYYSGDIIIPAAIIVGNTFNVEQIDDYAFYRDSITSVTIPESITSIGEYAFCKCKVLTSVIIPSSVTRIDAGVFYECTSLTSVTIPNTVDTIGKDAFAGCTATIYCDVEKRPDGWDSEWRGKEYKGEIVWKQATEPSSPVTETAANSVSIYAYGRSIVVENAAEEICVYDAMGRLVCRDAMPCVRTEMQMNNPGLYIVKVGDVAKRVMVK